MNKEELEQLYVVQELPVDDIAKHFNLSGKSIRQWVKRFNLQRDPAISQRYRVNKQKQTYQQVYHVDHYSKTKEFKEQVKQTCLEKYGVDNVAKSDQIKEKIKQNNLEKYGETNPLKVKEIKERIRLEQIERKGYAYPCQQNKNLESMRILSSKGNLKEYLNGFKNKPTINQLVHLLSYHRSTISQRVKQYQLEDLVHYKPDTCYELELQQLFPNVFYKTRKIIPPQEIDLYNSQLKLGIEFNGDYWHSVDNKGRGYHQNKSLLAKEKGIRLIHIFEYEWLDKIKREKLITLIKNIVDDKRSNVYARQCEIREIDSNMSSLFLNSYHLQSADKASIRIGLFYNELLIGVMTFCKPRFNKKYEWELSRFCIHSEFKIVGGAERLLKYFQKVYNPHNMITYCDISKFTGGVYKRLGFTLNSISNPNYVWCNYKDEVLTRYQCQHHKLIEKFPDYAGMSEDGIMYTLGYWKIEDSGNQVWVKDFN